MKIGVYPGSFDPLTYGHTDIILRASKLFDVLYIAVASNPSKKGFLKPSERIRVIEAEISGNEGLYKADISIVKYDGLIVKLSDIVGANAIIRGIRTPSDFEFESQMSSMNREMSNNNETLFLASQPQYQHISSTLVRQIFQLKGDISKFIPKCAAAEIRKIAKERTEKVE